MTSSLSHAQLRALGAWLETGDRAVRLAEALFDFAVAQPAVRYVDPERVLPWIDAALSADWVGRAAADHLVPAFERERMRAHTRADRLGDALPSATRDLLEALARQPASLSRKSVERWVRHEAVTHLLRSVVAETLDRFMSMLRPEARGGLLGHMARGPGAAMWSRLLEQMQAPLQKAATRFVASSVEAMIGPVVKLLTTQDMASRLGRLRAEVLGALLDLHTADLLEEISALPLDALLAQLPAILGHNLARQEVREAILSEVRAALEREGTRSVSALLGAETTRLFRQEASRLGGALLGDFFGSRAWDRFMEAAE